MCGICGKYSASADLSNGESLIRQMCAVIKHRGPDDEGVYISERVLLGNRRLSIIDLVSGYQPLSNEDGTIWIILNGEIYNYRELAIKLKELGHKFQTRSDTETIVHLYEEKGYRCVEHLNGIFAFAIWDSKAQHLLLARDRLGVKPLFYTHQGDTLLFGSEIKSLLQDPTVERRLDLLALGDFFSLNYIPSPRTALAGISSLPAGHLLVCQEGNISITQYWDLDFGQTQEDRKPEEAYVERLRYELQRAVRTQLVSDVPVGAFLSGGIDSSTTVSFMAEMASGPVKTFNVGFTEESYDESRHARLVSRHLGTEHHEVICGPGDFIELLPRIIWHADNLLADVSLLPMYMVSQLAGQHVKVVLSGDGADELFAGYTTYQADRLARWYRLLPSPIKGRLIPAAVEMIPTSTRKLSFDYKVRKFIAGADYPPEKAHYSWRTVFTEQEKQQLFLPEFRKHTVKDSFHVYERFYRESEGWDDLSRHQHADIKVWMADSILAKVDYMSMAHSLEVRVPFLDHRLVEFMATVPSRFRRSFFTSKHLLRETVDGRLPHSTVYRAKAGFMTPVADWMRNEAREMVQDVLSASRVKSLGYFNYSYIERLIEDHIALRRDNSLKLLGLLSLFLWHEGVISPGTAVSESPVATTIRV